jgi:hypothetical protein
MFTKKEENINLLHIELQQKSPTFFYKKSQTITIKNQYICKMMQSGQATFNLLQIELQQ